MFQLTTGHPRRWSLMTQACTRSRPYRRRVLCLAACGCALALAATSSGAQHFSADDLPDAPSAVLAQQSASDAAAQAASAQTPCRRVKPPSPVDTTQLGADIPPPPPCEENPIQNIISTRARALTSGEKGILAIKDILDPFNLIVIAGGAGISVAANPDSAYGAGFKGWGRLTGYSMVEDAQGEFFGTWLIPSLVHEDPRYHRMPGAPVKRRVLHALAHTFVTRHDDGSAMPNYATLLTYPISAELSNLYVPGISTDGPSTARRIGIGLATDPAGSLVAEFLPDIAKRIHIRVLFMQQILNQVAVGAPAVM